MALAVLMALPGDEWETRAEFQPLNPSPMTGDMRFIRLGKNRTKLSLSITGLQPSGKYTVTFRNGYTCEWAQLPPLIPPQAGAAPTYQDGTIAGIIRPPPPIVADKEGSLVYSEVQEASIFNSSQLIVVVAKDNGDAQTDKDAAVACGVVKSIKVRDGIRPKFHI